MSVSPRCSRPGLVPPGTVPVLVLWVLALAPYRVTASAWLEALLAASVLVLTPRARRSMVAAFAALRIEAAAGAAAAMAWGHAVSLTALCLDAAGKLPAALQDARGGPLTFFAVAATIPWLEGLAAARRAGPGPGPDPGAEPELTREVLLYAGLGLALGAGTVAALCPAPAPASILGGLGVVAALALPGLGASRGGSRIHTALFERSSLIDWDSAEVVAAVPFQAELGPEDVLGLACAVESTVAHPLRDVLLRAIDRSARTLPSVRDVEHLPGLGVRGKLWKKDVLLGGLELLAREGLPEAALAAARARLDEVAGNGQEVLLLAVGGELAGAVTVRCPVNAAATACIEEARRLGLRVGLLTYDSRRGAGALGAQLPFDEVHVRPLPAVPSSPLESSGPTGEGRVVIRRRPGSQDGKCPGEIVIDPGPRAGEPLASGGFDGIAPHLRRLLGDGEARLRRDQAARLYHLVAVPALAAAIVACEGSPLAVLGAASLGLCFPHWLEFVFPPGVSYNRTPTEVDSPPFPCRIPARTRSS